MDPNDQDKALWEALGQAREPRVSPFFARNVLREVRALEARKPCWYFGRVSWKWAVPAVVAVTLALGGIAFQPGHEPAVPASNVAELPIERIQTSPDYDVIAELDALLANETNATWLDTYASN